MTCLDEERATLLAEGKLTPGEEASAWEHIDGCAECRLLVACLADGDARASVTATAAASTASAPLEPGSRVGRYVVIERAGRGAMGTVYAAYDPDLDRKVALKLLHPGRADADARAQLQSRLLREAQAMAKLSHPN